MTTNHQGHDHNKWSDKGGHLVNYAEMTAPLLDDSITWVKQHLAGQTVHQLADLGSGPGVTTTTLALRFPAAKVTAVDGSRELLEQAKERASTLGLTDRVHTVKADLDGETLPALGTLDLAWAGMLLHHLHHPERLLAHIHDRLTSAGHIVIAEFGLPRPVSDADGREPDKAAPGHHVIDWGNHLEKAGYRGVEARVFAMEEASNKNPEQFDKAQYAFMTTWKVWLGKK